MKWLFILFGKLPLRLNHLIGAALGWLAWWLSARHRLTTTENIKRYAASRHLSIKDAASLQRQAIAEQGKGITELAIAWTASIEKLNQLFAPAQGWEHVEAALQANQPIIFVSPHLGCFDIAGRYIASRVPITALYRPPKQAWLAPIMAAGRARGGATVAPANATGVRALLKALKSRASIMILPDQVPAAESGGEGVWVDFFNHPAYTMTLLPRLAASNNATVLYFFAERLSSGSLGYRVHIVPMDAPYTGDTGDKIAAARQTNAMVEKLIDIAPAQYLWGYNRYKRPAGAPPPDNI
jgi:Kdo2-lipid IVA lauroyltransferase/acyltransferase